MRKVYLLGVIMAMLTTPVLAGLNYPDIDVSGEIKVTGTTTNNAADFKDYDKDKMVGEDSGNKDKVETRVRVNMKAGLSEGVAAYADFEYPSYTIWGDEGKNGETINSIEDNTYLRHAYLTIADVFGLPVDLSIGRQGIGKNNHELVMYFDSINAKIAKLTLEGVGGLGDLSVTGICARRDEETNADANIQGLTATLGGLPAGAEVTGYYLRESEWNANDDLVDKNNVIGVKVDGSMEIASAINYFFEYAMQTGGMDLSGAVERDASALHLGGGYKTDDAAGLGALSVEASYLNASGDDGKDAKKDKEYDGIAPNLDYCVAMIDTLGQNGLLTNMNGLTAINFNASVAPQMLNNLEFGVSYTKFASAEKVNIAGKDEDDMGNEIDLTCKYAYNDATSISLTYGMFSPGDVQAKDGDAATMLKGVLLTEF